MRLHHHVFERTTLLRACSFFYARHFRVPLFLGIVKVVIFSIPGQTRKLGPLGSLQ